MHLVLFPLCYHMQQLICTASLLYYSLNRRAMVKLRKKDKENIKIYRQSSSYIQVKSSFGLEMQIQTHPFLQLYIIVDENFATTTHGLCGNFDGNSQNDFKSSMGIQEGTASSFVDSWRVIEHCQSAQDIDSHPCSLSQSNSK
ncbi:hypothetical protein chiPu_0019897 [Chiloscyllium punctatum]|uniref:VWFD domain-containing protein n=1 Tax=Chiloscyllium punctatum TaxID=137246 RepID=A0A401RTG8_CHIPU|nr:hypothetical protein [Chiloscyllium punctatum]